MKALRLLVEDATRLESGRLGGSRSLSLWRVLMISLSPRMLPCTLYRVSTAFRNAHIPAIARLIAFANFVLFGIEIAAQTEIGGGLLLLHPHGTVLGAARIGKNVTILQGVTLGAKTVDFNFDPAKRPIVEDGVVLGAGAKVLGRVRIGMGATVGANAVVICDVRPGSTVGGVPAREL